MPTSLGYAAMMRPSAGSALVRVLAVLFALCAAPDTLRAQLLRGTVRDSATSQPVLGAVVTLLDSAGTPRTRSITNARGQYSFQINREIRSVRVQRIGFRARTATVPAGTGDVITVDVSLGALITLLAPTQVVSNRCPRRSDAGVTAALLEQARTGLLSAVVARESNPSEQVRIKYQRALAARTQSVLMQEVSVDNTYGTASFGSALSAANFVAQGFVETNREKWLYHAPDADVLLNDEFVNAYCFQLSKPERERPNQVGLQFRPAETVRDRIDVEGTLWVDTLARSVREIVFQYRGLKRGIDGIESGGTMSFRELANGVVLADKWTMRLANPEAGTTLALSPGRGRVLNLGVSITETGGLLARAIWPDGHVWQAPLGALYVTALRSNLSPASFVSLKLVNTDYAGVTDSLGRLTIGNVIPGPYSMVAIDNRLQQIGLDIETSLRYVATGDSVVRTTVKVPTAEDYVAGRCGYALPELSGADTVPLVAGRLTGDASTRTGSWRVQLTREIEANRWEQLSRSYAVGEDGMFFICSPELKKGATIRVEVHGQGTLRKTVNVVLGDVLSVLNIPIDR